MACTFGHLKNCEVGADVDVADAIAGAANSEQAARAVLSALCRGDALFLNGEPIADSERKVLHDVLLSMYEKAYRAREEKRISGVARGCRAGRVQGPQAQADGRTCAA